MHRFKKGLKFQEMKVAQSGNEEAQEAFDAYKKAKLDELMKDLIVYPCDWVDKNLDTLKIPTGLISLFAQYCSDSMVSFTHKDARDFEDLDRRKLTGAAPSRLRDPQIAAMECMDFANQLDLVKGMGMFLIATGVGKTALAQEIIRKMGFRSLFIVPSVPILRQTVKRFEEAYGKKNVGIWGDGTKRLGYVTVATYASIYNAKADEFDDFRLAIFDEAHHVAADTFFAVACDRLRNVLYRYGLTAFRERADGGTILVEAATGPIIYSYDAPTAIADGYLAQPTYFIYDVTKTQGTWDKYKIKGTTKTFEKTMRSEAYTGPDDGLAYKHWVLGNDLLNKAVSDMVASFTADNKSVLILVDEIDHGKKLQALIPNSGYCVGGGKDNEQLQRDFNSRKLKVLLGTSCLSEGTDTVPVDVLIELQGGASKSKILQADGRALRNDPDENGVPRKPTTIIIDFNFPGNKILERHSRIREATHAELGPVHKAKLI